MDHLNAPVEELLQEPQGRWGGFIGSHEDCAAMRSKLNSAQLVDVDSATDDFPHTPEAKRICAYQLWEAMVNYTDYIEAADNKNHYQVGRVKAMSEVEMEVLAWELLKAIENAHLGTLGFTVTADSAGRRPTWRYSAFGSFGARFEKVKEACRRSKSIVYNLTTSSFILKLTADPEYELYSKKSNKIINDRRAMKNKSAKGDQAPAGPAGPVGPAAPAPVEVDEASSQPGRTVPRAPPLSQAPSRVRAGRVTKTKQRGNILSQHTAAGLANAISQHTGSESGLANAISQHTATGSVSDISQHAVAGLADPVPQHTATELGNPLPQHAAMGFGNSLPQHTSAGHESSLPQQTAAGHGSSLPLPSMAGTGFPQSSIQTPPAAGPPGQAGVEQGHPATLEEILQVPLDDNGSDRRYRDVVKDLLRNAAAARRRGQ